MATMGASMGEGAGHGHTGSSSSEKGWQAMKRCVEKERESSRVH
jgi:hypothetical protein